MTAVVSIADTKSTPTARQERLTNEHYAAVRALRDALVEEGLLRPYGPDRGDGQLEPQWERNERALIDLFIFWESRVKRLEKAVRACLACDGVPEEQRRAAMGVLSGRKSLKRDLRAVTDVERRLVEHYRRLDDGTRLAIRTLMDRLADAGKSQPADTDAVTHDAGEQAPARRADCGDRPGGPAGARRARLTNRIQTTGGTCHRSAGHRRGA